MTRSPIKLKTKKSDVYFLVHKEVILKVTSLDLFAYRILYENPLLLTSFCGKTSRHDKTSILDNFAGLGKLSLSKS